MAGVPLFHLRYCYVILHTPSKSSQISNTSAPHLVSVTSGSSPAGSTYGPKQLESAPTPPTTTTTISTSQHPLQHHRTSNTFAYLHHISHGCYPDVPRRCRHPHRLLYRLRHAALGRAIRGARVLIEPLYAERWDHVRCHASRGSFLRWQGK